ncbi:MAG: MotA/TolQ/ExbB proton channel family protein [Planctomycetaceae bacterium]|nr:MotA/TolQ/ExbB proton channel family protein [Planctomycetaceae bacterium]
MYVQYPIIAQLPIIPADQLTLILSTVSRLAAPAIAILFVIHLVYFFMLWGWYRRDIRNIASALDSFTRDVRFRSVLDRNSHLCDQIEAFLADINEVLEKPDRKADRVGLSQRIHILDEKRTYLQSMGFETGYNFCRTMIEAYPIAGILGTIIAIGVVLRGEPGANAVQLLVTRFGESIWATFAGLSAAITLMALNSLMETSFDRLSEDRRLVRETMFRIKRVLATPAATGGESA